MPSDRSDAVIVRRTPARGPPERDRYTPGAFTVLHPDWCPNAGLTPPDPEIPERLE